MHVPSTLDLIIYLYRLAFILIQFPVLLSPALLYLLVFRDQLSDWPPIKPLLRSTLTEKGHQIPRQSTTFFVKVYMEGIPIGRKLDLFSLDGYDGLIKTLRRMFRTSIMCPDIAEVPTNKDHVLTYEDKEGDWMMVGDVPWEMFLTTVERLKITRADKC